MAVSSLQFLRGIFLEHIEEAAFLYDQCRQLRLDEHTEWPALGPFEDRLEKHLDALCVGQELALEVCDAFLLNGEPGEVFAALSVVCRNQVASPLASLLASPRLNEPGLRAAVSDALARELPKSWEDACVRALANDSVALLQVVAATVRARRLNTSGALHRALEHAPLPALANLLESCASLREPGAIQVLRSFYGHADPAVREQALRGGLRVHDDAALRCIIQQESPAPSALTRALSGGRLVARQLLIERSAWSDSTQGIQALGLLGDLAAVRPLIGLLNEPELAQSAAEALHVITGAPLMEGVHVDEEVHEDELFERELERFHATGEVPRRADGNTYGDTVRRLSRNPTRWDDWVKANAAQFDSAKRYRFGRLCTPAVTLRGMTHPSAPKRYRELFGQELLIRYGIEVQFDAMATAARQRATLKTAVEPVLSRTTAFEPGCWYLAERKV